MKKNSNIRLYMTNVLINFSHQLLVMKAFCCDVFVLTMALFVKKMKPFFCTCGNAMTMYKSVKYGKHDLFSKKKK